MTQGTCSSWIRRLYRPHLYRCQTTSRSHKSYLTQEDKRPLILFDTDWIRTGSAGAYLPGSSNFYDYETLFGIDIDGGGAGSGPTVSLTLIESSGSASLQKDSLDRLYVNGTPVKNGETHLVVRTGSYVAVAAETDDGVNKLVFRRDVNDTLLAWTLDTDWIRTGSAGRLSSWVK